MIGVFYSPTPADTDFFNNFNANEPRHEKTCLREFQSRSDSNCSRQNRLEIEKKKKKKRKRKDFPETLPVLNFCRVMKKNAYIFFLS